MNDLSSYSVSPGGAFDDTMEAIALPRPERFEHILIGDNTLLPVPVTGNSRNSGLVTLPYQSPESYNNQPVLVVARVRLFEPFRPFPDRTHALPRDTPFDAYIIGANSTDEYALLDAVAFGGTVLSPVPVRHGHFRVEQWYEGDDLTSRVANAPHFRERVFGTVPEAFYQLREKRSPRAGQEVRS